MASEQGDLVGQLFVDRFDPLDLLASRIGLSTHHFRHVDTVAVRILPFANGRCSRPAAGGGAKEDSYA